MAVDIIRASTKSSVENSSVSAPYLPAKARAAHVMFGIDAVHYQLIKFAALVAFRRWQAGF